MFAVARPTLSAMLVTAALTGCSVFEPDYYNCDSQLTSYPEASRSTVTTQITNQDVEVRFNGVSATCYDEADGTVIEVAIGLKVLRDLEDSVEVAPVNVPLASALIAGNDTVLSSSSFSYDMQFPDGVRVLYPLVRREFKIPRDGRVVLALTPEILNTTE